MQEKVTLFKNITSTQEPHHSTLKTALGRIKNGRSRSLIEKVRGVHSVDERGNPVPDKTAKKELPVVLFSGKFDYRADEGLVEHNNLVILDFDNIAVDIMKPQLAQDKYTYACWISPSGNGLKVLVKIQNSEHHRDHYRAILSHFESEYDVEVDSTSINESRACYESWDEDLVYNENAQVFTGMVSVREEREKLAVVAPIKGTDYNKVAIIVSMIRRAPEGEKHKELIKAAYLAGGYISGGRMDEQEIYDIMVREIEKKNPTDLNQAKATIIDGLEAGKNIPTSEVVNKENEARRQMLILDNDYSFLSDENNDFAWIEDYAAGNIKLGLDTGNKHLDEWFRYKPEFLIINGHSNVGKTTLALYMMVNSAVRHNWKWIVYSSENRTASIKMRLMEFVANCKINEMSYEVRTNAFKWVAEHFTVIGNESVYSYRDLIVFAEKMIHMKGNYQGFFIDPYNSLKIQMTPGSSISTHEYHYEAASEFLTFANRNNMAVWLNTHAVTEAQRRKGVDGLPTAPYAEDTEGGGKFVNRADSFCTFHRKVQSPEYETRRTMEFHVRKVRETETGGSPTPLEEPFLFRMNATKTGFSTFTAEGDLFSGLDFMSKQATFSV